MRGLTSEEDYNAFIERHLGDSAFEEMERWLTTKRDPLVDRVVQKFLDRSNEGMKKYGVTMERPDVTTVEWLRHAQEEAMDLAVYLQRCIEDLENDRTPPTP